MRRMTEQEILKELDKRYPNRTIYSEKNMECGSMIRPFCKMEGVSFEQWLLARGFSLKKTGYVESDMKMREVDFVPSGVEAFEIADYVFRKYPLAGEYRLTEQEDSLLYNAAQKTIHKVLVKDEPITDQEAAILTLETIQLLKKWSPHGEDIGESRKFWNYIYLQYGFNSEKSEAASKILYKHFRFAIERTMDRYGRFFAPEGTMRYYTTLMLHALAPRQSIGGFFNILFAWLGLICFLVPLTISIANGTKGYCNRYCGRGQLFGILGGRFGLSRKKDIPRWMKSKWFRYGFLIFFFVMFFQMLWNTYLVFAGVQDLKQVVTLLWTFKLPWNWAYHGTLFHPGVAQFAFGFYSVMLTSTVLGLITMVLYKPRSWCVYCPMGTMTQLICKVKDKKDG